MEQIAKSRTAPALPWMVILAGCAIAGLTFGPRSALGFFQLPMLADRGWDRTVFGFAMALLSLAWGIGQPVFGALADRFGTWRVLALAGVVYAAGLSLMAVAQQPVALYVGGVLAGLGVAAGSFGIILAAFARSVPEERRSFVFGVGTAAGSAGMFIFAPVTQGLIDAYGWPQALFILSLVMLMLPLVAIPLVGNARSAGAIQHEVERTARQALREALRHRSFLLLTSGFFVCGFQVSFVGAHFPAYLGDIGIAPRYAVIAIALIGFFNIIGSLSSGLIGQHFPKRMLLAAIYLVRALAITIFMLAPKTPTVIILFSIVIGLFWLATVPPTNGLVAIMFGTRHLGMLGGVVFLSHQVGSFLGVWLGGFLHDAYGSYDGVWWLSVALAIFAAAVHWPIVEQPAGRLAPLAAE